MAAISLYRSALEQAPELRIAQENLCLALLAAGEYADGFRLYDTRFDRRVGRVETPNFPFPQWRGEPATNRSILVLPEQGLGDQIMFIRFVRNLAASGAKVTVVAPKSLTRLFSSLPARVVEQGASVARHDFWVMVGSLPDRLSMTATTLWQGPYLPQRPGGTGVGVAWRGDPRHHNDAHRSLPPELGRALLDLPHAVSLAPEDTAAGDFAATAAIIANLQLVVTVDTAVAHLAAAMGKPCWVLLPRIGLDWRWGDGITSLWYPEMRLLRQAAPGEWPEVLHRVQVAIEAELAQT